MPEPLLCELHAHTTWSDGALTLPQLVDLYGRSGFDVLAVTDHVVRDRERWCAHAKALHRGDYGVYLEQNLLTAFPKDGPRPSGRARSTTCC